MTDPTPRAVSDLTAKIRERCEDRVENCLDPQAAAQALLAVLEIHRPDLLAMLGLEPVGGEWT